MNWKRKVVVIAVAALVALAIAYGFVPRPLPVDFAELGRGPMSVSVVEEGKTRVIDRFEISAPVAGFARRIELDVGDAVEKGQVVAEIEPRRSEVLDPRSRAEAAARVSAARAALSAAEERAKAARAEADYAEAEFNRVSGLFDGGYVSGESFDRAEADHRNAKATLRSADFAVKVAEYDLEAARTALRYSAAEDGAEGLEKVLLKSPVGGSVLAVHHESEGKVEAGEVLLAIGDTRAIEVEADVLSDDAVRIKPGMRVLFERWGGEEPLEGKVKRVEPAGFTKISALGVEEQRVLVISDIISHYEEWGRLGDGYRVEARFVLWEDEDVLRIPESALFRHADGWAAFVVEGGRARRREVSLGHRSGLTAEVVSGIDAGEKVITHPDDAIEDGTRVRLRNK
ncbi:MAG: HlyD family efflux transporter periplasmic adaptor subunit [Nitrospirota bacterium]|jgi:HlyD family secretion protein